jgi:hypothetical protein
MIEVKPPKINSKQVQLNLIETLGSLLYIFGRFDIKEWNVSAIQTDQTIIISLNLQNRAKRQIRPVHAHMIAIGYNSKRDRKTRI